MNDRTGHSFAELVSFKLAALVALPVTAALLAWSPSLALGFALGVTAALVGAYFSWLHLSKLSQQIEEKSQSQIQRSAAGGTLANVALMAVVLAVAANVPWLNVLATAAGLFVVKLLAGLTLFLRRSLWKKLVKR